MQEWLAGTKVLGMCLILLHYSTIYGYVIQVPTYKNDFPNWELDNWAQYSLPYVPPFLKIGVTIMSLILGAVIVLVIRHRKAGGASSAVVSSAGSVQPSVRGYQQLNQEDH